MTAKCTLVTGGTGLIGRQLVACLRALGEDVILLSRHDPGPAVGEGVRWVGGDVSQPQFGLGAEGWRSLVADTRSVFHLAARTDFTGSDYAAYEAMNVDGALHALDIAAEAGAPLHHVSTAFVCGKHSGRFAETDLEAGQGFRNPYEQSKHEAERRVRARAAERGVPLTVYRPGIVLEARPNAESGGAIGPLLYVDALVRLVARRSRDAAPLRLQGNADAALPLVYDHHVAYALAALAQRADAPGRTWHLVAPAPVPNRMLESAVNAAFGRTVVRWATAAEFVREPETSEEKLFQRKASFYAPYHDLSVAFDRRGLDDALGADALPAPTRVELEETFLAFVESRTRATAVPAAAGTPAAAQVRRYFDEYLPGFRGRRLLPNLATFGAEFSIDVNSVDVWSLAVREGVLEGVWPRERRGAFGYRTEPGTFLQIVRGQLAPQESFFSGHTRLEGEKLDALKTATVLEEFFRKYPFPEPAEAPSRTDGMIPLDQVPVLPWKEILAHAHAHLNPGLIDLLELGEFTAVDVRRAEGAALWDQDGRRIVDFVSSYGALNLGHNHPRVRAALQRVMDDRRVDLSKEMLSRYTAVLAHNLAALAPGDLKSVYFCNSGAESVEAALKLAQRFFGGKRNRFVYAEGSMHGKTIGALSVTGGDHYRDVFRLPEQVRVPYGDLEAVAGALRAAPRKGEGAIAGVIVEPIQGEAGVRVPPEGYLAGIRRLCDEHGALLILDEVQTGYGRTGTMFGCQAEGVVPDIMATAKSLGGGMASLGAMLARSSVYRKAYGNPHDCLIQTTTFGGRTSACAAGIAALEALVDERLPERAARLGAGFRARLQELAARHPDWIREVRGRGLMLGIEFQPDLLRRLGSLPFQFPGLSGVIRRHVPGMIAAALLKHHGILCSLMLNDKSVLRVYPPLVVEEVDLARFADALEAVFRDGFDTLVKARIKHALAVGGLRFLAPWIAAWQGK